MSTPTGRAFALLWKKHPYKESVKLVYETPVNVKSKSRPWTQITQGPLINVV